MPSRSTRPYVSRNTSSSLCLRAQSLSLSLSLDCRPNSRGRNSDHGIRDGGEARGRGSKDGLFSALWLRIVLHARVGRVGFGPVVCLLWLSIHHPKNPKPGAHYTTRTQPAASKLGTQRTG